MNKKWFKAQFKKVGKPQSALAEVLNVEPSAVSRALSANRRFKADEVATIAKFFSVPVADVIAAIQGEEPPLESYNRKNTAEVAISGKVNTAMGGIIEYFTGEEERTSSYTITFKAPPGYNHTGFIAFTVAGDHYKLFPEGTDLVFAHIPEDYIPENGAILLYEVEYNGGTYLSIGKLNVLKDGVCTLVFEGKDFRYSREHIYKAPSAYTNGKSDTARGKSNVVQAFPEKPRNIEILGVLVKSIRNEM